VRRLAWLVLLLAMGAASALAEPRCAAAAAELPADATTGRFHLQSRFWVNLHQRLMYAARFESTAPAGLSASEQAAWDDAVGRYRNLVGTRLPFQDRGLVAIQTALSTAEGEELPPLPEAVSHALRKAAPAYRRQQWAADDRANRYWITVTVPQLQSAAEELACEHARVYGMEMPRRVIVDVASHAWQFGAYTVGDRETTRTVLSSRDPGYAGLRATEMVFHEASHGIVGTRDGAVGADITRAARELSVVPPPNLWHAVLFMTSGELARRALADRGVVYEPVSDELFQRAWPDLKPSLAAHWTAVLDGRLTREDAMRNILRDVGRPRPSPSPQP
jgi:hypothetical protein